METTTINSLPFRDVIKGLKKNKAVRRLPTLKVSFSIFRISSVVLQILNKYLLIAFGLLNPGNRVIEMVH